MTTPDPEELYRILEEMRRSGVEIVVMEVSSHALALHKVEPIIFDVSVFTNLTEDHLDFHGDMESYFGAKAKLMAQSRRAVINLDDRYMRTLKKSGDTTVYTCSAESREAMILAEDIHERGTLGIEYKITSRSLRLRVRLPMAGRFNVMNTMQAAVAADLLGVPAREIRASLSQITGAAGRLERLNNCGKANFSVYIDYAHTPDALENLLRTVRGFLSQGERLVLLFGCGGDRDRLKRPMMGRIATSMADQVIITSDNCRSESPSEIIADILQGVSQDACYIVIEDRREAIEYAIKSARVGDVILLAGKGHETYEIDRHGKRPFNEKRIVELMIEKYYG
jgi:UDP-N-acetylmuramyl-tripeptide synthetase